MSHDFDPESHFITSRRFGYIIGAAIVLLVTVCVISQILLAINR